MNRAEMVNAIYDKERIRSELISKELWKKLAEMTDEELEKEYERVFRKEEQENGQL